MSLNVNYPAKVMTDTHIWLSYSKTDPIVSSIAITNLIKDFEMQKADLTLQETFTGHQLTKAELIAAEKLAFFAFG